MYSLLHLIRQNTVREIKTLIHCYPKIISLGLFTQALLSAFLLELIHHKRAHPPIKAVYQVHFTCSFILLDLSLLDWFRLKDFLSSCAVFCLSISVLLDQSIMYLFLGRITEAVLCSSYVLSSSLDEMSAGVGGQAFFTVGRNLDLFSLPSSQLMTFSHVFAISPPFFLSEY